MRFNVTFGPDSHEIDANTAEDAWASFCTMNRTASKHPNLYARTIEAVDVVERPATVGESESIDTPEVAVSVEAVPDGRQEEISTVEAAEETPISEDTESSMDGECRTEG